MLNLSGLYRFYSDKLEKEITEGDMPNHIAIVLDGNRRWAKRNLVIEKQGHFQGADAVENLLDWCEEFDIKIITLYVLSAENLGRKNEELEYIFELIKTRLEKLYNDPRIHKNKMRVKAIGRIELLPDSIKNVISRLDDATKGYDNHFLNIAIAYGGSYLPQPSADMILRTSGEKRMSGFLMWQSAYSELVFLDVFWPGFRKIDLMRAIRVFQKRKRRIGK